MIAKIVLDCAFGDAGKGVVTDNLCHNALNLGCNVLIVRFSGGQQAGHTVIRDGKKHIFSSFGAGSLEGVPTFFTEDTTMYLPNLINEYNVLRLLGVNPILKIHPLAMITTPYDIAYNRVKERAESKHGSCGLGIGATMHRNNSTPFKLYTVDFEYPELLRAKLRKIKDFYYETVKKEDAFTYEDELSNIEDMFYDNIEDHKKTPYFTIGTHNCISKDTQVIFEGSQGIMLDMDHGVFPNVTYANTTCKNAMKYVKKWNLPAEIYYVSRCYTTRHGKGWMPKLNSIELINNKEEINVWNPWQEEFKFCEFSYDLINHAMLIDSSYHEYKLKKNLVITCLDQRPDFTIDRTYKASTELSNIYTNDSPHSGNMKLLYEQ